MKRTLLAFLAVGAALVSTAFSARASDAEVKPEPRPTTLQITVITPASPAINRDADIAETFGYLMATKLREQGLQGRIVYVDRVDKLEANAPHLELRLVEWRVDPMGNVDCTFTANLRSSLGSKSLGMFMGSSMLAWPFESYSAHDAAFQQAATEPVKELLGKIKASGLLPDGSQPKTDKKR